MSFTAIFKTNISFSYYFWRLGLTNFRSHTKPQRRKGDCSFVLLCSSFVFFRTRFMPPFFFSVKFRVFRGLERVAWTRNLEPRNTRNIHGKARIASNQIGLRVNPAPRASCLRASKHMAGHGKRRVGEQTCGLAYGNHIR